MRRRAERGVVAAALALGAACIAMAPSAWAQGASAPGGSGAPAAAPQADAPQDGLTMDRAVATALTRNRDVIAARLEIEAAEVDRIGAGLYWNPQLFYTVGNIVIGAGNPQGDARVDPGPFSQLVQSIGVSEVIDVWAKRSARIKAADLGIELRRLRTEDALREIVYAVRSAFTDVIREQQEQELSRTMKSRYDDTVKLSRARVAAGEISEFEGQKIELEGLRYQNALIEADTQLDLARQRLAALMGLPTAAMLGNPVVAASPSRAPMAVEPLVVRALQERPDLRAARKGQAFADAMIASAEREAYPDISLGATFVHSGFTVSGDNPNALALSLGLPLPVFDRNQAGVARARLDAKRFVNDVARLELLVRHDVTEAVRRVDRARALLDVYETGGLITRAETQLRVAESSYRAGAVSLLELLEAQRTFIETRAQYLRIKDDHRKAAIDVAHAVGREVGREP